MTMTLEPAQTPAPVSIDLPFAASSAGIARGRLQEWLDEIGAEDERREDARLLLSELVGNSVRHARPLDDEILRVEWRQREAATLSIAVTDGGATSRPEVVDAGLGDTSGRGMAIVEILARRWWVESDRQRTTVHAEVPLD